MSAIALPAIKQDVITKLRSSFTELSLLEQQQLLQTVASMLESETADTARLDWLEQRCSSASDSELCMPFKVYWGGGIGLRRAIDRELVKNAR